MDLKQFVEKSSGQNFPFDIHVEIPISPLLFRAAGLMDENGTWTLEGKTRNSIEALILLMYLTAVEFHFTSEIEIESGKFRGAYVSANLDEEPEKVNPLKEIFMKNRIATASRIFQSSEQEESILLVSNLERAKKKDFSILFDYLFFFHPFPHMFVDLAEPKEIQNKWIQVLIHFYNQLYNDRLRNVYLETRELYVQIFKYVEETRSLKRYTAINWNFGTPNFSLYASEKEYENLLDLYWLMSRIFNFYSKDKTENCEKDLIEFTKLRRKEENSEKYKFRPENIFGYKNSRYEGQHEIYRKIFPESIPEELTKKVLKKEIKILRNKMMQKNVYTGDYREHFLSEFEYFYKKNFKSFMSQETKIELREKILISNFQVDALLELANNVPKNPMTVQAVSSTFNRSEIEGSLYHVCNNPVNPENSFHPNAMLLVLVGLREELERGFGGFNYYTGYTQKDGVLIMLKIMYLQYIIESDHVMHMKMYLYYLSGEFRSMLRKYKEEGRANRVAFELMSIVNEIYDFASKGNDLDRANQLMDSRFFQKTDEKTIDILFDLITNADLPIPEDEYRLQKILKELPKDHLLYQGFKIYYDVIYHYDVRWSRIYLSTLWKIRKVLDFLHLDDDSFEVKENSLHLKTLRFLRDLRKKGGEEKKRKIEKEETSEFDKEMESAQDLLSEPFPEYCLLKSLNEKINSNLKDYYGNKDFFEKVRNLEKNFQGKDKNLKKRFKEMKMNGKFLLEKYNELEKSEEKELIGLRFCNPLQALNDYFLSEILDEEIRDFVRFPIFEDYFSITDKEEMQEEKKNRILEEYKTWSLYVNVLENRLKNYLWVFKIKDEEIQLLKKAVRTRARLLKTFGMEIYEETPEMKLQDAIKLFGLEKEDSAKITRRQILTAYYRLALKYHPDRASHEYNEHIWNDVQRANEMLMEKFGVEEEKETIITNMDEAD